MAGLRESSLVNFRALQEDSSSARRGELMRNIVALVSLASDSCGPDLLNSYDSVMVKLADMVEPSVRTEVATRLAELPHPPAAIVHKLALDDIDVAQPLIVRSAALNEDDLIGLAEIRGCRHRYAIAVRPGIGERLTTVLVSRGDDRVRRALAGNVTARFTLVSWERLVAQAETDTEMQELLAEHPGTPHEVLRRLADFAETEVGTIASRRAAAHSANGHHERAMPVERLFAGYDFAASETRVRRRIHRHGLSFELVARLAADNAFGEAAVALAALARLELDEVLRWFADCNAQFIVVVAKASNASEADFAKLLNAGPIRFRLSANERASALEAFRRLDADAAKLILARRREELAA